MEQESFGRNHYISVVQNRGLNVTLYILLYMPKSAYQKNP